MHHLNHLQEIVLCQFLKAICKALYVDLHPISNVNDITKAWLLMMETEERTFCPPRFFFFSPSGFFLMPFVAASSAGPVSFNIASSAGFGFLNVCDIPAISIPFTH